jgi:hypothetical protein
MSFINFSRNPIPIRALTANQLQPNFHFLFIIKIYNAGGQVIDQLNLRGVPDSSGEFVFDARPILHAMLKPDIPSPWQTEITAGTDSLLSWSADLEEWYGDEPIQMSTQRLANNKVLLGGLSFREFPGNNFFAQRENKFLSWAPATKLVGPDQPDFLYYLVPGSWSEVYLHAEVFYADGSSRRKVIGKLSSAAGKLAIFPAGFERLQLNTVEPLKQAIYYNLWGCPTADPNHSGQTEKRSYLLDYFVYPHAQTFLFQNSLGGFETLRCTGEVQWTTNMERQTGERVTGPEYAADDAQMLRFGASSYESVKANTGMQLNRAWFDYLQEFFRSDYIFRIGSDFKLPVVLEGNQYKRGRSNDYEYAADFEYSVAQIDNAYTP